VTPLHDATQALIGTELLGHANPAHNLQGLYLNFVQNMSISITHTIAVQNNLIRSVESLHADVSKCAQKKTS